MSKIYDIDGHYRRSYKGGFYNIRQYNTDIPSANFRGYDYERRKPYPYQKYRMKYGY